MKIEYDWIDALANHFPHFTALYSMFIGGIGTLSQTGDLQAFLWILIGFSSQIIGLLSKVKDLIEKEMLGHSYKYVLTLA